MPPAPIHARLPTVPEAETYVTDLREFFLSRQVACGQPQDLAPFALRLAQDASLAEETASMVRSVLYQEGEALSAEDLCPLLVAAVGGPVHKAQTLAGDEPYAQLLGFVRTAIRPQGAGSYADLSPEAPPEEEIESVSGQVSPEAPPALNQPAVLAGARDTLAALPRTAQEQKSTNQRLSHVLFASPPAWEPPIETAKLAQLSGSPEEPLGGHVAIEPPTASQLQIASRATSHRTFLLCGVVVLLLALSVAGWALHRASQPVSPAKITFTLPASPSLTTNRSRSGSPVLPVQPSTPTASTRNAHSRSPLSGSRHNVVPGTVIHSADGVFLASSGPMAGHLIFAPAPGYPKLASLTRTQGQVVLQVVVTRFGSVGSTRVLDGPHLLRGAAEHAVRQWRYRPFIVNGKATDVSTMVTVTFRLHP